MNNVPTFADIMVATVALLFPMVIITVVAGIAEVTERISK
jgi:hypothetical protein